MYPNKILFIFLVFASSLFTACGSSNSTIEWSKRDSLIPQNYSKLERKKARPLVSQYYALLGNHEYTFPANIYDDLPDISDGQEGELKQSEKDKVLDILNTIRALHSLPPISYHPDSDIETARSSLIMSANKVLTHTPDDDLKFWSKEGAKGAISSNIYQGTMLGNSVSSSESFINAWVIDNQVESLGHRRWILYPQLKYTSFGRVDGNGLSSGTLKVIFNEQQNVARGLNYVAYPYKEYPASLFKKDWYLSFSANTSSDNRDFPSESEGYETVVNFEDAEIIVRDDNGDEMDVHETKYNNSSFGLSNILQWKVKELAANKVYQVTIEDVLIKGKKRDYTYTFKLIL
jgi:uncharacterized protein YkwD